MVRDDLYCDMKSASPTFYLSNGKNSIITYSHEFSAGSHKLSEAEEKVLFCGQDLSQLMESIDEWIRHPCDKKN